MLKYDWELTSVIGQESEINLDEFEYSSKLIASAHKNWCYQQSVISDNRELLAVSTSKDNILLYNIESTELVFDYVGHTG